MRPRTSRRQFLARAGTLGAGLMAAALLGCTDDDAPGNAEGVPGSRVRVRTVAPRTERPAAAMDLHLGALASEVGADGLGRTARLVTYSRLVGVDQRSASVYGDLASEVELPEPLVVRVGLRPGVFFHPDGQGHAHPLTADAFVREAERRRAEGVFLFDDVLERVEAPSDTELLLHLRAPFSLLFEFLARDDASVRGEDAYGLVDAPLGSGPFMPSRVEDGALVLRPNPVLEAAARPRLARLAVHRADTEGDLDALFGLGVLHVRHHPDEASRRAAESVPGRQGASRPRHRMRGLAVSLLPPRDQASQPTVEAFRDARVRRALSLALDRQLLAEMDGAALSGPVGPGFGGDALPAVELQSHPLYQHNAAGARALLEAAGHHGVSVRISHADTPMLLAQAQAVVEQLAAAGFAPRLVTRPQPDFQTGFLGGDFEAAFFELDSLATPDIGLRLHMSGGLEGSGSPWGYSNPVYDAAVRETLSQVDPVLRTRMSRDAQRMLLDDVPAMLPLTAPPEYASLAEGVAGYDFDAYDFNPGMLAAQWQGPPLASGAAGPDTPDATMPS